MDYGRTTLRVGNFAHETYIRARLGGGGGFNRPGPNVRTVAFPRRHISNRRVVPRVNLSPGDFRDERTYIRAYTTSGRTIYHLVPEKTPRVVSPPGKPVNPCGAAYVIASSSTTTTTTKTAVDQRSKKINKKNRSLQATASYRIPDAFVRASGRRRAHGHREGGRCTLDRRASKKSPFESIQSDHRSLYATFRARPEVILKRSGPARNRP